MLDRLPLPTLSATFQRMQSTSETSENIAYSNWESLCKRCGECCFEKSINKKGKVITLALPCRFLDIHSRECRIYQQRQQAEEDCIKLTPKNIDELQWLPPGCAYRSLQKPQI